MRIFKRGKTWHIDFVYQGKRHRKAIGYSKKVAEEVLADTRTKILRKEYLNVVEDRKITLEEYTEVYLEHSEATKTDHGYERDKYISRHLCDAFGDKYLFDINYSDIERYKHHRLSLGRKKTTINRELDVLRSMLNYAVRLGYLKANPVQGMERFKTPPGRLRFLSDKEEKKLIDSCEKHLRPIVIMAINSGCRREEILSLKWKDVRFHERIIVIHKTKNLERKVVPMNSTLYDELSRIFHDRSEYVFCDKKGRRYHEVKKSWKSAVERAGIKDFRFHDLRHHFASHLVMNQVDLRSVQTLLGHKDIRMTMRYSHLSDDHLQRSVETLDRKKKGQDVPSTKTQQKKNGTNKAHKAISGESESCK